jgi:glycosyltransferase involved in cell wall biosynthesis
MNYKVSVVLPVYNGSKYLGLAIDSILTQSFKDFELIVVNDGSTDASGEVIGSFNDNRLKVITNPTNVGITKSLNIGVKAATGKYIARMDSDDISEPIRLEKQYEFMERNPKVGVLGSNINIIDTEGNFIRFKGRPITNNEIKFYFVINNPFVHSSVMVRKVCFDTLGFYDEDFKYAQDYELWQRFSIKYRMRNLKRPLLKWRSNREGISYTKTANQYHFAKKVALRHIHTLSKTSRCIDENILHRLRLNQLSSSDKANYTSRIIREISSSFEPCDLIKEWAGSDFMENTSDFELSVVMCTYSNVKLLKRNLPIILNEPRVKQVIIIDNASRDSTLAYLDTLGSDKLYIIRNTSNRGVIKARNQGLNVAYSKYTMVLDDDQIPSTDTFDKYATAVQTKDIVGFESHIMDFETGLTKPGDAKDFSYIGAGGMCMLTSTWKKLGFFDETFSPCLFEDPDLCIKAKKLGFTLGLVENNGIKHVAHSTLNDKRLDLLFDLDDVCVINRKVFLNRYGSKKVKFRVPKMYKNVSRVVQEIPLLNGSKVTVLPGHHISDNKVSNVANFPSFKLIKDIVI